MNNPRITLLIFSAGKINLVGGKKGSEIFDALNKIYPLFTQR